MRKMLSVALVLVATCACAPHRLVSDKEAAYKAASCLAWPNTVAERVSHLSATVQDDTLLLALDNASMVYVSKYGVCKSIGLAPTISGAIIHRPAPNGMTEYVDATKEEDGTYVLFLVRTDPEGTRQFLAMKGGGVVVDVLPPAT